MRILLDTNILTRSSQPAHPHHHAGVNSPSVLRSRGDALFLVPQNLYEFWVVATRPLGENGLGMSVEAAEASLGQLKRSFTLLQETPAVFAAWESLVVQNAAKGKAAHDARLVAAMKVHNLDAILTFNKDDFTRYSAIVVLKPDEVVHATKPPSSSEESR